MRLRAMYQRVAAYGWTPTPSKARELIESAGVDAWIEGPAWGVPLSQAGLAGVLAMSQRARRAMQGMSMSECCLESDRSLIGFGMIV